MTQIKYGLFLGLIGTICSIILAATFYVTDPIIRANQEAAVREAISRSFPNMDRFETIISLENGDVIEQNYVEAVQRIYQGSEVLGYFYTVQPVGFGGGILFATSVDLDGNFSSFYVISHGETPGFVGAWIDSADFENQVIAQNPSVMIDTVSGATVSSSAIGRGLLAINDHFTNVIQGGN